MYFGALSIGAELAVGAPMAFLIATRRSRVQFIFKDFQADFLRRADGHVRFVCSELAALAAQLEKAESSQNSERFSQTYPVLAYCKSSVEPIAKFAVTISVKERGSVAK